MFSRRIRGVSEALIDTFNRKARALAANGVDLISLGQALPGFSPPAAALEAARRALARPETHVYAPDAGDPELQTLIADWIARHDGFSVDPRTQIIVTAGGNQAAMLALQCCCDAGDRVLVPSPYFMNHEMAVRLVDAVPVEVATTDHEGYMISAGQLFGRRTTPRTTGGEHERADESAGIGDTAPRGGTSAIMITTPNNPTGAVVPAPELDRLAEEAAPHGMFLIVDRTYAGFEFSEGAEGVERPRRAEARRPRELRLLPPNVVIVGSFSKVFAMTGWRVGYLAGSPELVAQALKAQDTMIICAPTISQLAVRAALKKQRGVPAAFMKELRKRRDYVQERIKQIEKWSSIPAAGGFFAFVRVAGCTDSVKLAHHLLDRAHVLVMPGRIFGEAGEGHIRISYGVADIPTLKKAFDRIEKSA